MPPDAANHDPDGWHRLHDDHGFTPLSLRETLDGGQAFRWSYDSSTGWTGVFGRTVVSLRLTGSGELLWRSPDPDADLALRTYLGRPDLNALARDALPWRSDPILAEGLRTFPGLCLLRQPLGETLLAFLCSATKRIVQIKDICQRLADRLGTPITPRVRALPTWEQLATVPEAELRTCALGFRARYVQAVARRLAEEPDLLTGLERLPYETARARLQSLPGVGPKVADCVLLFGAGRLEAFPVDTWILRCLRDRYGLAGWSLEHLAQFGRIHFGAGAGLAQQYLFALERLSGPR